MDDLVLHSIEDRGVANLERVLVYVKSPVRSENFALCAAHKINGKTSPVNNQFFWFGSAELHEGDWLIVFTGQGHHKVDTAINNSHRVFSLYWGCNQTLFHRPEAVAVLMELADIDVSDPVPPPEPQWHTPLVPLPSVPEVKGLLSGLRSK